MKFFKSTTTTTIFYRLLAITAAFFTFFLFSGKAVFGIPLPSSVSPLLVNKENFKLPFASCTGSSFAEDWKACFDTFNEHLDQCGSTQLPQHCRSLEDYRNCLENVTAVHCEEEKDRDSFLDLFVPTKVISVHDHKQVHSGDQDSMSHCFFQENVNKMALIAGTAGIMLVLFCLFSLFAFLIWKRCFAAGTATEKPSVFRAPFPGGNGVICNGADAAHLDDKDDIAEMKKKAEKLEIKDL